MAPHHLVFLIGLAVLGLLQWIAQGQASKGAPRS